MANLVQNREESVGSQKGDHFVNLERRRGREYNRTPSVMVETQHIKHTERSHSRSGSHVSHKQETRKLKLKIYHLRKKLCWRERDRRSPSPQSSDESRQSRDRSYHHRFRSPPSESFSTYSRLDKLERNKSKRG